MSTPKKKHKTNTSVAKVVLLIVGGLGLLSLVLAAMLRGKNIALFHTKGIIAQEQRELIIYATIVCLVIAVPTILLLYFMAWRYRQSNDRSKYHPEADRGAFFNVFIWALPATFMAILAVGLIPATHKLQPNKAIASNVEPITIQVTAMRWKWLFVYPEQQIATVNYVQLPEDVPVVFDLIADEAPMSSFWIPNLGGQLYAMTGHVNRLNLIANEQGDYRGRTAEINGPGFAGMQFDTRVTDRANFDAWVLKTRNGNYKLDKEEYEALLKPSEDNEAAVYASVDTRLFGDAIMKYAGSKKHDTPAHGSSH